MLQLVNTKEIILALKQVYKEQGLSVDKVLALVNKKVGEGVVSRSTIQAVFAKDSEDSPRKFGYETALQPICIALLDIESIEGDDSSEVKVYKAILKYKKSSIGALKDEKLKLHEEFDEEAKAFSKQVAFLSHQIELKDQRIDSLLRMNDNLTATNNKLINQLMDCPLRKCDED